jgi:hypothetical protein
VQKNEPVQRSLKSLRAALSHDGGPLWRDVRRVETWMPFPPPGHRSDLFGILDILAVGPSGTLGVQCSTVKGFNAHRRKMEQAPEMEILLEAGWQIELHGWHKPKYRWECRAIRFFLEDSSVAHEDL